MDSAILNSLPSIHTTLIGIGAAFYSAYAIYAYQKIQESRIKLERTSKDATDIFNHLNGLTFGGADHLLTNGELEWETCKSIIKSSWRSIKDQPNKYLCESLCALFTLLYTSPPFQIKKPFTPGAPRVTNPTPNVVDEERLEEIALRISGFAWIWENFKDDIISVARLTHLQEKEALLEAQRQEVEQNLTIPPEQRAWVWETYFANKPSRAPDYEGIIKNGFEGTVKYRDNTLKELKAAMDNYNLYNSHFEIKKTTLHTITLITFLLATGVFLPPVLLDIRNDFNISWPKGLDYLLLAITTTPYAIAITWLQKKLMLANID